MDIFSDNEIEQREAIQHLYKELGTHLKSGVIIAKYRELIIIDSLAHNQYSLGEVDTFEYMSQGKIDESIVLNYELYKPLSVDKMSLIGNVNPNILLDPSYLLIKQQIEVALEQSIINFKLKDKYKATATVSLEDYLDNSEILADVIITLYQR